MSRVFKYAIAGGMWFFDQALFAWLFYISRTVLIAALALSYEPGAFQYRKAAELVDKVFTLVLGIGWLAFIVFTEEYYRAGALKEGLVKRFARVTGPMVLCIFILDLILFWLQGVEGQDWWRWLILSTELVVGLVLVLYGKKKTTNKPQL